MAFILRRLGFYVIAAWVALTANFFLPRLMPGNAVEAIMSKYPSLQPSAYKAISAMLGLSCVTIARSSRPLETPSIRA